MNAFFVFRNKIVFVCIGRNIIIFLGLAWNQREEEQENKVRRPLFSPFCSKSAKFGRKFVRPLYFLFGPFKLRGRIFGQVVKILGEGEGEGEEGAGEMGGGGDRLV